MKKTILALGIIFICLGYKTDDYTILVAGNGFDNIKINETTKEDIIKLYGKEFNADTCYKFIISEPPAPPPKIIHSICLSYQKTGLYFYFYPDNKGCFAVSVKAPFKAKTEKGIILDKSTFNDVVHKYGETDWYFAGKNMVKEYPGIKFYREFDGNLPISDEELKPHLKKKVTEITIEALDK